MKFTSDKQRKAVMANMQNGNTTKASSRVPTPTSRKPTTQPVELYAKKEMTEQEVNLMMRRINAGKIAPYEIFAKNKNLDNGYGIELSDEQNKKGLTYLRDKWKTPTGTERKNNPFGSRETAVLEDTNARITLQDFYSERGNWYAPMYSVSSKNGAFDYVVVGGEVKIMG